MPLSIKDKPLKIGIMGGTFNPIHNGHLMIAENAREQFGLDKIIFIPTGHTLYKDYAGDEMTAHRINMTKLAIADNEYFEISLIEAESPDVSCTCMTVEALSKIYPGDELYFILGGDSLYMFDKWVHPERICQKAHIICAVRDSMTGERFNRRIEEVRNMFNASIYPLATPEFNVSGNELRKRVYEGHTIRYMVPDVVERYIVENELYLTEELC